MGKKNQREVEALLETMCSNGAGAADARAELVRWVDEEPGDSLRRSSVLAVLCKKRKFAEARPAVASISGPHQVVAYTRAELATIEVVLGHFDADERALRAMLSSTDRVSEEAVSELRAWLDEHPAQALDRAKRILDLARAAPVGRRDRVNALRLCLPVVQRALGPHDALPHDYVAMVEAEHVQHDVRPLPTRTKKTGGPYRFVDPVRVLPTDYAGLDALGKAQWLATASGYVGAKVRGPRDFIAKLRRQELHESDGEMRRWRVLRGDQHVFDAWLVWVENGAFFRAGTPELVPAYLVQDSYLPSNGTPDARRLAEELESSAPADLWTMPAA